MKRGVEAFNGSRLAEARQARGMTKVALSQLVDVSQQSLSEYERDQMKPMPNMVERLARALGFPQEFFFATPWPEPIDRVFWRARSSDTKRSQDETKPRIAWALQLFSAFQEYLEFPHLNLPRVSAPEDPLELSMDQVEDTADEVRSHWGIGDFAIPDLALAIENLGIPVISIPIASPTADGAPKQAGFTFWSQVLGRPLIGHNLTDSSRAFQRFSLAHELAHVLLHRNVPVKVLNNAARHKLIESQANRFAGALLFPRDAFFDEVREASIEEFYSHKGRRGMSILAMLFRARDLGVIDGDRYIHLIKLCSRKGYRKPRGEPLDDHEPLERPRMLRRAVEAIEVEKPLLNAAVASVLPLPTVEYRQIVGRDLVGQSDKIINLRLI